MVHLTRRGNPVLSHALLLLALASGGAALAACGGDEAEKGGGGTTSAPTTDDDDTADDDAFGTGDPFAQPGDDTGFGTQGGDDGTAAGEQVPEGYGLPCGNEFDCQLGTKCNMAGGTCVQCTKDDDCGAGLACNADGLCKAPDEIDADNEAGCTGEPLIQISPNSVEFGNVSVGDVAEREVVITNVGDCPLTILEVNFQPPITDEFVCEGCSDDVSAKFPVKLKPREDSLTVTLLYAPADAGQDTGFLLIVSNDPSDPTLQVALSSTYKGVPVLQVEPAAIDFGFVDEGASSTQIITITNAAEQGNAGLQISKLAKQNSSIHFTVTPAEPLPVTLAPGDSLEIEVTYSPQDIGDHEEKVVIESNDDSKDGFFIQLNGTSVVQARAQIEPLLIDFGQIPVNTELTKQVLVSNTGGANLDMSAEFNLLSSVDFTFEPTVLPTIGGGGSATFTVKFKPTTVGIHQAILEVTTSDPAQALVKIEINGEALEENFNDILKLDMSFDNSNDGWANEDFRDVDLQYEEGMSGAICNLDFPAPDWTKLAGNNYGRPKWIRVGLPDPVRIIHVDPDIDDTCFHVAVRYMQDCAFIAKGIMAQVLNIGPDLLISGLTSGAINVDLDLSQQCFDFSGTNATVTAFVNGKPVFENSVHLGKRGDREYVMTVKRSNGRFTPGPVDLACSP